MQAFLQLVQNKYFLYILLAISIGITFKMRSCQEQVYNEKLATYERQLNGQLSDKERELQSLHAEIGVAQSELMSQKELNDKLSHDKEEVDENFEKFKKKHDLEIVSRDKTIASLKQQISGGNSSVVINSIEPNDISCLDLQSKCIIGYEWSDSLNRFRLKDPNIFNKNDEVFESTQHFKIYGEIYKQKDGSLETRRLVLREVYKLGDEYKEVPGGLAIIESSQFDYTNPPLELVESHWYDVFRFRAIALGTVTMFPDLGATRFGLGVEFFNLKGFGINTHTAIDFTTIKNWEHRVGIGYNPTLFGQELNLALGASVGTPYTNMFKDYSVNLDLIFYLNN